MTTSVIRQDDDAILDRLTILRIIDRPNPA